jgi:hypothetical protein
LLAGPRVKRHGQPYVPSTERRPTRDVRFTAFLR